MEKIRSNFSNVIKYFILLQPIIDLITSISLNCFNINLTFGMIIRTIFLCFVICSTVMLYKKKLPIIYYILVVIYLIMFITGIFLFKNGNNLMNEIQGFMRCFYFPLMLVSLYSIRDEVNIDYKWIIYMLITYLILIFLPNIFNVGFKSYQITKEGSIGFFNSANEISAIISILTPFMLIMLEKGKKSSANILVLIIYFVTILTIGTKTPLLSLVITLFFYIIWKCIKLYKTKRYKLIISFIATLLLITVLTLILLPKTSFFKNIETHMEFLDVDNIGEIIEEPLLIDHFIFSQRLTFLDNKNSIYEKSNNYEKIFGIGYYNEHKETKMIEIDYFDIFYSHGPVGFILCFLPYGCILLNSYNKNKKRKCDIVLFMNTISIFLILLLSFFTGHIITAPAVSLIATLVIIIYVTQKKIYEDNNKKDIIKINNYIKNVEKNNFGENVMILKSEKKVESLDDSPKISIIVPIYNSSKYLEKCIKSLLEQTMQEIEILLINDGSTDNCEEIIHNFVDKRIRYFKHKNQGIGKTRNFGIKKAKGKYLLFVDSDDYIKSDMCEKMYHKAENENVELVVCDFYRDKNGIYEKELIPSFATSSIKENPKLLIDINLGPCNKLYKRQMVVDNYLKFEEKLKYEDVPFVIDSILYSKKIGKLDECLTFYCIHGNSETTIRDKRMFDILKIVEIVRKKIIMSKINIQKTYVSHLIVKIITNYTIQQRYQKNRKIRNQFIDESFNYLKKYVSDYKNNKYYENRGIIRRTIEKNKMFTKLYCDMYNVKK